MSRTFPPPRSASIVASAIVALLLLAQNLALWHAQAHPGAAPAAAAMSVAEAAAGPAHDGHAEHPGWGHAEGDAHCRLIDQLLSGLAGPPPAPSVLVEAPPVAPLPVCRDAAAATPRASYQARAPPLG